MMSGIRNKFNKNFDQAAVAQAPAAAPAAEPVQVSGSQQEQEPVQVGELVQVLQPAATAPKKTLNY